MKQSFARILMIGGVAGGVLFAGTASAIDWNVTGFVRQEITYHLASNENPNNIAGNLYNNRIMPNMTPIGSNAALPISEYHTITGRTAGTLTNSNVNCRFGHQNAINAGGTGIIGAGIFRGVLCPNGGGSDWATHGPAFGGPGTPTPGFTDNTPGLAGFSDQGEALNDSYDFNTFNTRAEIDIQAKINQNWAAYMKIRAYYDGTHHFTDARHGNNFTENNYWGGGRQTIGELGTNDAIIDLPAFYVDYNRGPLWLRAGNQTIAWGEAYFFRVMDVANGLDLRRHLTLGPGAEEYQDQRIASPGLRLSYTFKNNWELDSFVQLWSPTVLPGQNTPYNLVPQGAVLNESQEIKDARGSLNFGARMTMPFTESFTGIIAYVNRRNPNGVFRLAEQDTVVGGLANRFCVGNAQINDVTAFLNGGVRDSTVTSASLGGPALIPGSARLNGCGSNVGPHPLAPTSTEGWDGALDSRLDPVAVVRHLVSEWPGNHWQTRGVFNFGEEFTPIDYFRTVEGFQSSFGGFQAAVTREFKRENVFIGGGNYVVTTDDPNSFLDQLIIRGEVSVTPNKRLTNNLSFQYKEVTDINSALILEKYHRFSDSFPATYIVMQWMHRTKTDLFERNLAGNGGQQWQDHVNPNTNELDATWATTPEASKPEGNSNANYIVFAFQQPFPNLVWRFDFSLLIDAAGGYLVQPGVRYRPAANWQWDFYATLIESPGGDHDTITESLDFADEMFVRLTYFF